MNDTAIPRRLRSRPTYQGMPIPASVLISRDGVPDFAALDAAHASGLAKAKLCQLCGQRMRREYAFVGGEKAIAKLFFFDGAMHEDCARYSFTACPYVSGRHRQYRRDQTSKAATERGMSMIVVPSTVARRMGIAITLGYAPSSGGYIIEPPTRIIWEDEMENAS